MYALSIMVGIGLFVLASLFCTFVLWCALAIAGRQRDD